MFYEEAVFEGVLCCRSTPDGDWRQLTKEELTRRVLDSQELRRALTFPEFESPR